MYETTALLMSRIPPTMLANSRRQPPLPPQSDPSPVNRWLSAPAAETCLPPNIQLKGCRQHCTIYDLNVLARESPKAQKPNLPDSSPPQPSPILAVQQTPRAFRRRPGFPQCSIRSLSSCEAAIGSSLVCAGLPFVSPPSPLRYGLQCARRAGSEAPNPTVSVQDGKDVGGWKLFGGQRVCAYRHGEILRGEGHQ